MTTIITVNCDATNLVYTYSLLSLIVKRNSQIEGKNSKVTSQ